MGIAGFPGNKKFHIVFVSWLGVSREITRSCLFVLVCNRSNKKQTIITSSAGPYLRPTFTSADLFAESKFAFPDKFRELFVAGSFAAVYLLRLSFT